jgi:outer membrane autotransporter protein
MSKMTLRAPRRAGAALGLALGGVLATPGAGAQVVCTPSAAPTPAIVGQNVTLLGNCTVAGVPATTGSEVWTVPVAGGGSTTFTRPLAAPPLTLAFASAGTQAITVQLQQGTLSAPFALSLAVQTEGSAVGGRVAQITGPAQQTQINAVRTQLGLVVNRLRYLRSAGGSPYASAAAAGGSASGSAPGGASGSSASDSSSSSSSSSPSSSSSTSADATRTGRLGVYVAGGFEQARQDEGPGAAGYRTKTRGASAGADYRLTSAWVLGAGVGALTARTDATLGQSAQEAKGRSATIYASWSPSSTSYIDAAYSVDRSRYELKRDDLAGDVAFARTRGRGQGLTVSTGVEKRFGAFAIGPYLRYERVDVRVEAFDELVALNSLQVGEQRVKLSTGTLGAQLQWNLSAGSGIVTPHLRVEITRIANQQQDPVRARLLNSSTALLVAPPAEGVDRSFGQLALGASGQWRGGWSMFVDFESGFGQRNFEQWRANGGVKLEF